MTDRPGLDFSFSGLKTAVITTIQQFQKLDEQTVADIATAFQQAVVDTLTIKCRRALQEADETLGGFRRRQREYPITKKSVDVGRRTKCPSVLTHAPNFALTTAR